MRHRLIPAILSLVVAASPGDVAADVRLVEAGIICPRESSGELVPAPRTEAGHIRLIDESLGFDLLSRTVPTMDGLSFGFRTELEPGVDLRDVTVVVTHPPMGAAEVVREEWDDVLAANDASLNLFTFEEAYEKVPGIWTFAIEVDGQPVVTVPFEVTKTDGRNEVERACFQFLS